jgi:hypothetical protein
MITDVTGPGLSGPAAGQCYAGAARPGHDRLGQRGSRVAGGRDRLPGQSYTPGLAG